MYNMCYICQGFNGFLIQFSLTVIIGVLIIFMKVQSDGQLKLPDDLDESESKETDDDNEDSEDEVSDESDVFGLDED